MEENLPEPFKEKTSVKAILDIDVFTDLHTCIHFAELSMYH